MALSIPVRYFLALQSTFPATGYRNALELQKSHFRTCPISAILRGKIMNLGQDCATGCVHALGAI